jgi:glucose-1-phosphate cytidylyltransferase
MTKSIKICILAGGLGTRLSEETDSKPKPMVNIGDRPIIWHLMNSFDQQGYSNFAIALGYKGDVIKRWLIDLFQSSGDLYIENNIHNFDQLATEKVSNWKVHAIETGLTTQTGGRIKMLMEKFPHERLLVTYGDGLANVNIDKLVEFHISHGKLATLTAVRPPARFGHLVIENGGVTKFGEKQQLDVGWINGGFFILEPQVANFIHDYSEPFESNALIRLVKEQQLMAYQHEGFWHPMDTLRERNELIQLAGESSPPWLLPN